MKRLFLLPILLVLTFFVTNSCNASNDDYVIQQENSTNNRSGNEKRRNSDLGFLHNTALDLYYENNQTNSSKIEYRNAISSITSYMKKYDEFYFLEVDSKKLIGRYNNFVSYKKKTGNVNEKDEDYSEMHDTVDYLKSIKEISEANYRFLVKNLLKDGDYETSLKEIDLYLTNNKLGTYDKEQIETVRSIYISSNEYWKTSKTFKSRAVRRGDPKSRAVIIADAVGGLLWASTGPFAVVGAAACSLIANEA
ncbi:hypothetical protein [Chryseobacterium paridis]|uniref:Lipoprotein n=1 Tax=Chryseobacterium paridis TaxID=2800328 RepID=A0ABS1FXR4_9FLAO|nr:hypothetical protein [Chryseobacterium paridis]MBK1897207.1 hypothetical protein [Chryseobacterium paridis]